MKKIYSLSFWRSFVLLGLFLCFFTGIKAKTYTVEDGVNDLQTTINNAAVNDTIKLVADYNLLNPLVIAKGIVIDGQDFYLNAPQTTTPNLLSINTTQTVTFLSIKLNNLMGNCVSINAAGTVNFKSVSFETYSYGIFGSDLAYKLTVSNCIFYYCSISVYDATVFNNTFFGTGLEAIYLSNGTSSDIYNNIFSGCDYTVSTTDLSKVHHNNFFDFSYVEDYYTLYNNFTDDPQFDIYFRPTNPKHATAGFGGTYVGANAPVQSQLKIGFDIIIDNKNLTAKMINKSSGYFWHYWQASGDYYYDYSYERDTVFQFYEPGYYTLSLFIYDDTYMNYLQKDTLVAIGDVSSIVQAGYNYSTEDWKTYQFTDASKGNISSYEWNFDDGTMGYGKSVSHTFDYEGIYNVCLTVTNAAGDIDQICQEFWAGDAACNLNSSFTYRKAETGNKVTFTNTSTGDFDYVYWDFGDGYISEDMTKTFDYTYEYAGYYSPYLYIYSSQSDCYSEAWADVQIGDLDCKADFSYTVDATNNSVSLKNNSKSGSGMQYWYFDDGDYSEDLDLVKKFDVGGLHWVGLIVWTSDYACVDYTEKEVQVGEINCSAKFTFTVDKATKTVKCKNQAKGAGIEYLWYFSDGTYMYDKDASHQFEANGYYTIELITYNPNDWCMDYYEDLAVIGDPTADCEAMFTQIINQDSKEVTFTDKSKGFPVSYLWDFGDGETSSEVSPSHIYDNEYAKNGGYFNVCLSITNAKGVPNISCKEIYIEGQANKKCKADFVFSKKGKEAYFTDKSVGNPKEYSWNYGDGSDFGTTNNPKHLYDTAGYYLVELSIVTDSGCQANTYQLVNIDKPDTFLVKFGYDEKPQTKKAGGYPVDFVGAGTGDQARLRWDFGDDSTNVTSTTPTHEYKESGTYHVCVTYEDPVTGAKSESCQDVTTGPSYVEPSQVIDSDLKIYPNPVGDELSMDYTLKSAGMVELSLVDLSGKKIQILSNAYQNAGCATAQYNVKSLKPGTYILQIKSSDGLIQKQVVKK